MKSETIWRYMDFTKFVSLISMRSLFFCRADRFEDPFEGSIPKKDFEKQITKMKSKSREFNKEKALYEKFAEEYRKSVYINCWHINKYESAALWKLYLKSNEGITIRSTRSRLSSSLMCSNFSILTAHVKYIDYDKDNVLMPTNLTPFIYKRKSFQHERELRAIIADFVSNDHEKKELPLKEDGIYVKSDLAVLNSRSGSCTYITIVVC